MPLAPTHPPIFCLASDDVELAPAAERMGFDMVLAGHGPPRAGSRRAPKAVASGAAGRAFRAFIASDCG